MDTCVLIGGHHRLDLSLLEVQAHKHASRRRLHTPAVSIYIVQSQLQTFQPGSKKGRVVFMASDSVCLDGDWYSPPYSGRKDDADAVRVATDDI